MLLSFTLKVVTGDVSSQDLQESKHFIEYDSEFERYLDSFNIVATSYGFILNFFNAYRLLDVKTNANGMKASLMALTFACISYLYFSVLVYKTYGNAVSPNIFDNLKDDPSIMSYGLRILFLFIFTFNLPYAYMIGKDSILTFINEI